DPGRAALHARGEAVCQNLLASEDAADAATVIFIRVAVPTELLVERERARLVFDSVELVTDRRFEVEQITVAYQHRGSLGSRYQIDGRFGRQLVERGGRVGARQASYDIERGEQLTVEGRPPQGHLQGGSGALDEAPLALTEETK